jgi:hypothetical protein
MSFTFFLIALGAIGMSVLKDSTLLVGPTVICLAFSVVLFLRYLKFFRTYSSDLIGWYATRE